MKLLGPFAACGDVLACSLLLKNRWLLVERFGIELGAACLSTGRKLSRDAVTGCAPVIMLACRREPASILDCCTGTRPCPNLLPSMELNPARTCASLVARLMFEYA